MVSTEPARRRVDVPERAGDARSQALSPRRRAVSRQAGRVCFQKQALAQRPIAVIDGPRQWAAPGVLSPDTYAGVGPFSRRSG